MPAHLLGVSWHNVWSTMLRSIIREHGCPEKPPPYVYLYTIYHIHDLIHINGTSTRTQSDKAPCCQRAVTFSLAVRHQQKPRMRAHLCEGYFLCMCLCAVLITAIECSIVIKLRVHALASKSFALSTRVVRLVLCVWFHLVPVGVGLN